MTVGLNSTHLLNFIANKNMNHLYTIENLLAKLLTRKTTDKCTLYCYLTVAGDVSVVLEAVNAADHATCNLGLVNLESTVEQASQSKFNYRIFQQGSWVTGKKFSFHHGLLEPVNYLEYQIPGGIDKTYLDANKYYFANSPKVEPNCYKLLVISLLVSLSTSW